MGALARLAGARHVPLLLGALAVAIGLPSVGFGLQTDDHLLAWAVAHGAPTFDLFQLEAGPLDARRASGYFPWWTSSAHAVAFLRPLPSLLHHLEFTLYPELAWLMHLENVLLYGAIVAVATAMYRRRLPAEGAALAGFMFAFEEGHAVSVGWISGRNTLLAMLFSLLALFFHERGSGLKQRALCAASVALALLSAEAGLWSLAFVLAAALAQPELTWRARLRTVAVPLGLGLVWAIAYLALGRGAHGSTWYRDPTSLDAPVQGVSDLPLWIAGLFGPPGMSLAVLLPLWKARLIALPIAALFTWLLWPALTRRENRLYALAALLALAPLLLTVPGARLLFGASFGACALIARAIEARATKLDRARRWTLLIVHAALPVMGFQGGLRTTLSLETGVQKLDRAIGAAREVVLIRSPFAMLSTYALCLGSSCGDAPEQRTVHALYSGGSALRLARPSANELELEIADGLGATPMEGIFGDGSHLRAGSELTFPAFRARVQAVGDDGRPTRVRFTFPSALETGGRLFLGWEGNRPMPFTLPPLGAHLALAPLSVAGAFAD